MAPSPISLDTLSRFKDTINMDDILVQERREAGAPSIDPDRDRVGFYFYTAAKVREVKVFGKPAND